MLVVIDRNRDLFALNVFIPAVLTCQSTVLFGFVRDARAYGRP